MNESAPNGNGAPRLAMIVARARNGVIGRDGGLPWRLKADLQHFKQVTMGKPILMGRKTWESLPKRLPGRAHFVLSRDPTYHAQGALAFNDFSAMLARATEVAQAAETDEIVVIGGEALFRFAFDRSDRLYITEVDADVEGDVHFPEFAESDWIEVSSSRHEADTDNDHPCTVRVLERAR